MKPPPKDWPRISSAVFYDDALLAIEFLKNAFGFRVQFMVPGENDRVEHSQLVYGEGLIMVSSSGPGPHRPEATHRKSPRSLDGGNTQCMMLFVDDADAHCAHARANGAVIAAEPKTVDYGEAFWSDRTYEAIDPEGHHWWFTERVRDSA